MTDLESLFANPARQQSQPAARQGSRGRLTPVLRSPESFEHRPPAPPRSSSTTRSMSPMPRLPRVPSPTSSVLNSSPTNGRDSPPQSRLWRSGTAAQRLDSPPPSCERRREITKRDTSHCVVVAGADERVGQELVFRYLEQGSVVVALVWGNGQQFHRSIAKCFSLSMKTKLTRIAKTWKDTVRKKSRNPSSSTPNLLKPESFAPHSWSHSTHHTGASQSPQSPSRSPLLRKVTTSAVGALEATEVPLHVIDGYDPMDQSKVNEVVGAIGTFLNTTPLPTDRLIDVVVHTSGVGSLDDPIGGSSSDPFGLFHYGEAAGFYQAIALGPMQLTVDLWRYGLLRSPGGKVAFLSVTNVEGLHDRQDFQIRMAHAGLVAGVRGLASALAYKKVGISLGVVLAGQDICDAEDAAAKFADRVCEMCLRTTGQCFRIQGGLLN